MVTLGSIKMVGVCIKMLKIMQMIWKSMHLMMLAGTKWMHPKELLLLSNHVVLVVLWRVLMSFIHHGKSEAVARCPWHLESFDVALSIALVSLDVPASQGNFSSTIPYQTILEICAVSWQSIALMANPCWSRAHLQVGQPFCQLAIDPTLWALEGVLSFATYSKSIDHL